MLSCHSATELIEKKQRQKLTAGEKTKLFFHTLLCSACSRYAKHSRILEQLFDHKQKDTAPPALEDERAKELERRILQQLNPE